MHLYPAARQCTQFWPTLAHFGRSTDYYYLFTLRLQIPLNQQHAEAAQSIKWWCCTSPAQGLKLEEPECIVRRFSMAWRWCYDVKLPAKLFQFPFFFALSPCFPWKPQALRKASCKTLIICRLLLLVRRKMFADFLPRITREATCGRLGRKQQQTTVRKSRRDSTNQLGNFFLGLGWRNSTLNKGPSTDRSRHLVEQGFNDFGKALNLTLKDHTYATPQQKRWISCVKNFHTRKNYFPSESNPSSTQLYF